jgi:hypothetical protein
MREEKDWSFAGCPSGFYSTPLAGVEIFTSMACIIKTFRIKSLEIAM